MPTFQNEREFSLFFQAISLVREPFHFIFDDICCRSDSVNAGRNFSLLLLIVAFKEGKQIASQQCSFQLGLTFVFTNFTELTIDRPSAAGRAGISPVDSSLTSLPTSRRGALLRNVNIRHLSNLIRNHKTERERGLTTC